VRTITIGGIIRPGSAGRHITDDPRLKRRLDAVQHNSTGYNNGMFEMCCIKLITSVVHIGEGIILYCLPIEVYKKGTTAVILLKHMLMRNCTA
jgi:hypothetical protein